MIHFAAIIFTCGTWEYVGLCGATGTNPKQYSNERGIVLESLGGRVTCPDCLSKMGAKQWNVN